MKLIVTKELLIELMSVYKNKTSAAKAIGVAPKTIRVAEERYNMHWATVKRIPTSLTKEHVLELLTQYRTITRVARELSVTPAGLSSWMRRNEIVNPNRSLNGKHVRRNYKTLEEITNNTGAHNNTHLKYRLLLAGVLKRVCYVCGITTWLDQPLSLQMDHIDGNRKNNKPENLRMLCPNCHSQTPTYGGKKR